MNRSWQGICAGHISRQQHRTVCYLVCSSPFRWLTSGRKINGIGRIGACTSRKESNYTISPINFCTAIKSCENACIRSRSRYYIICQPFPTSRFVQHHFIDKLTSCLKPAKQESTYVTWIKSIYIASRSAKIGCITIHKL